METRFSGVFHSQLKVTKSEYKSQLIAVEFYLIVIYRCNLQQFVYVLIKTFGVLIYLIVTLQAHLNEPWLLPFIVVVKLH